MPVRPVLATVLLALAPAVALAACSDDGEGTTTTTSTTEAARNFQVQTPQGQVSLSLDGELPPGWPEDFPLPDGAEPAGSGSLGGSDQTVRVAVFTVDGSGQETLDFYVDNDDLETENPSVAGAGDRLVGSVDLVSPDRGSITVLAREGTTYLVVNLTEGGSGDDASTTTGG